MRVKILGKNGPKVVDLNRRKAIREHGYYTPEAIAERRYNRAMIKLTRKLVSQSRELFNNQIP